MADQFMALLAVGAASVPLASLAAALIGRRRRTAVPSAAAWADPSAADEGPRHDHHLAPTIEAAELQLALLYRRMRAHLRDPHDYAASRIAGDAGFEECLDSAVELSARIGDLGGAAAAGPAERERMRGRILEGLVASCRTGGGAARTSRPGRLPASESPPAPVPGAREGHPPRPSPERRHR